MGRWILEWGYADLQNSMKPRVPLSLVESLKQINNLELWAHLLYINFTTSDPASSSAAQLPPVSDRAPDTNTEANLPRNWNKATSFLTRARFIRRRIRLAGGCVAIIGGGTGEKVAWSEWLVRRSPNPTWRRNKLKDPRQAMPAVEFPSPAAAMEKPSNWIQMDYWWRKDPSVVVKEEVGDFLWFKVLAYNNN